MNIQLIDNNVVSCQFTRREIEQENLTIWDFKNQTERVFDFIKKVSSSVISKMNIFIEPNKGTLVDINSLENDVISITFRYNEPKYKKIIKENVNNKKTIFSFLSIDEIIDFIKIFPNFRYDLKSSLYRKANIYYLVYEDTGITHLYPNMFDFGEMEDPTSYEMLLSNAELIIKNNAIKILKSL